MVLRYQGGDFYGLIKNHKKFIMFVYDQIQTEENNFLALRPTWIRPNGIISKVIQDFPNVTFVETMYNEVIDELIEMGYQPYLDVEKGGLKDNKSGIFFPIFIGFDKGWKKLDSVGKCYCMETLSEILFELYPEDLMDYLNQPV